METVKKYFPLALFLTAALWASYHRIPAVKNAVEGILPFQTNQAPVLAAMAPRGDALPAAADFEHLDAYARNTPERYAKDVATLAQYLSKPANNDLEKARLVFSWLAAHIRYDAEGYASGRVGSTSADRVLSSRKSVCEGYSNLFAAIGTSMGLEVKTIDGFAKGIEYLDRSRFQTPNHSWNAVRIGQGWKLIDATWGSGYGKAEGRKFEYVEQFDPFWFDLDPRALIFTHYPQDSVWQCLEKPLSKAQFEKLPMPGTSFFQLGFPPETVLNAALDNPSFKFPTAYQINFRVQVKSVPIQGELVKGHTYDLVVVSDDAAKMAVMEGSRWTPFTKKGNLFHLKYTPYGRSVSICAAQKDGDKTYATILTYQ